MTIILQGAAKLSGKCIISNACVAFSERPEIHLFKQQAMLKVMEDYVIFASLISRMFVRLVPYEQVHSGEPFRNTLYRWSLG